jgi:hypothetical protein
VSVAPYPLQWPFGWPRTVNQQASRFGERTPLQALKGLQGELESLDAKNVIVSSNVTLGGILKNDSGVCVYFTMRGKTYALPCDKWIRVEDNLWALAKHVEALRGQERWGVGTIERAFAGYLALPSSAGENPAEWWTILKVDRTAGIVEITDAYRARAKELHPDAGGSERAMALLNAAFAEAKRAKG